jgi:hypothetical protein
MMKITIDIPDSKIDELLDHAADSWIDLRDATGDWKKGTLKVKFDREQDDEGNMKGRKTIGRAAVAKGLAAMIVNESWAFNQWMDGDDDMTTCDAAYQCIIFGKTIYS